MLWCCNFTHSSQETTIFGVFFFLSNLRAPVLWRMFVTTAKPNTAQTGSVKMYCYCIPRLSTTTFVIQPCSKALSSSTQSWSMTLHTVWPFDQTVPHQPDHLVWPAKLKTNFQLTYFNRKDFFLILSSSTFALTQSNISDAPQSKSCLRLGEI